MALTYDFTTTFSETNYPANTGIRIFRLEYDDRTLRVNLSGFANHETGSDYWDRTIIGLYGTSYYYALIFNFASSNPYGTLNGKNVTKVELIPSYGAKSIGTASSPVYWCVGPSSSAFDPTLPWGSGDNSKINIRGTLQSAATSGSVSFDITSPVQSQIGGGLAISSTNSIAIGAYTGTSGYIKGIASATLRVTTSEVAIYYSAGTSPSGVSGIPGTQISGSPSHMTISSSTPTSTDYYFTYWLGSDGNAYSPGGVPYVGDKLTLTAQWTIKTYNVTYSYGSSVITDGGAKVQNQTLTLRGATFSRTGYTQTSWSGGYALSGAYTVNAALSLTPVWTANTYTVSFNSNGGSSISAKTVTYDSTYGTLTSPTRTGYTFTGWYYGSTQITSNTIVSVAGNHVLVASWAANSYAITFDRQSGTGGTTSLNATYDQNPASITPPTRTGYLFGGYYTGTEGSGTQYFNASGTPVRAWTIASSTTLYALWTAITYSVRFNKNHSSATGSMGDESFTYDAAQALTTSLFARAGYTIAGWASSAEGAKIYNNGQSVSNLSTISGSVVDLYAVWKVGVEANWANDGGSGPKRIEVLQTHTLQ